MGKYGDKPRLYAPNTDDFNNNGLGLLSDCIICDVTEAINGEFEIEIQYPISGANYGNIAIGCIIISPINPYQQDWQPFRIYYISKEHSGIVTIKAEHKSYELNGYTCLPNEDYKDNPSSCSTLMAYLSQQAYVSSNALGSQQYSFSTDIQTTATWKISGVTNVRNAMNIAAQAFNGEWEYNGASCVLKAHRGTDRNVNVSYGQNLTNISQTQNDKSYTHLMPYWTDGTETVYLDGYFIQTSYYSPTLQKKIKNLDLSTHFDEKPTKQQLLDEATRTPEYLLPPTIELTQDVSFVSRGQTDEYASISDVDHVEIGDDIGVVSKPLNINTSTRCNKIVYNVIKGAYKTATLGLIKSTIVETIGTNVQKNTKVLVSDTEPTEGFASGDYWIKIDNEYDRNGQSLARYQEGEWKLLCKYTSGSGGGGVGENVGYHNERFNAYDDSDTFNVNTITASSSNYDYNNVKGRGNKIINSTASICYGLKNEARQAQYSIIGGGYNKIGKENSLGTYASSAYYSAIFGSSIDIYGDSANHGIFVENSIICGDNHENKDILSQGGSTYYGKIVNSLIAGRDYKIGLNVSNSILAGYGNEIQHTVENAIGCGIGGYSAKQNGSDYIDYKFFVGGRTSSEISSVNIFDVDSTGNVRANAYNSMGADYAEYFEWLDGNPDKEDRRGLLVSLNEDKIELAHGDEFIGVISANPTIIGNTAELWWKGHYKTDVFGALIYDEHNERILSDDYDPKKKYIPRSDRQEWAVVGFVGRLVVIDNGKCKPNEYISARNGIAVPTNTRTAARVLRRIDDTHIEVLIK